MTLPALNGLDYALVAIVVVSAGVGVIRGVVREVISVAAWVLGIWVAWRYGALISPYGEHYISNAGLRLWVARLAIVTAVLVAGAMLAWLVRMLMRSTGLSGLDRLLGMVFGVVRGVLIVVAAVWTLRVAGLEHEPWWRESKLIPYAAPALDQLRALIQER
jgi:membrane protein required for colicin V production